MSLENAKALIEKLKADHEFGKRLEDEGDEASRIKIMKDAGFDFTREEFLQAAQGLGAGSGELTEEDLKTVAGGLSPEGQAAISASIQAVGAASAAAF